MRSWVYAGSYPHLNNGQVSCLNSTNYFNNNFTNFHRSFQAYIAVKITIFWYQLMVVGLPGLEPGTSSLALVNQIYLTKRMFSNWWAMRDSNLRPRHYQWRALTIWANRPYVNKFKILRYKIQIDLVFVSCIFYFILGGRHRIRTCDLHNVNVTL